MRIMNAFIVIRCEYTERKKKIQIIPFLVSDYRDQKLMFIVY